METGTDPLIELSETTAATVAIALGEYASFWESVVTLPGMSTDQAQRMLRSLAAEARPRAILLTALSRAISEYGFALRALPEERDPRILAPVLRALAESFSLVALSDNLEELRFDVMLSPRAMQEMLDEQVIVFISTHGADEARRTLGEIDAEKGRSAGPGAAPAASASPATTAPAQPEAPPAPVEPSSPAPAAPASPPVPAEPAPPVPAEPAPPSPGPSAPSQPAPSAPPVPAPPSPAEPPAQAAAPAPPAPAPAAAPAPPAPPGTNPAS